MIDLDLMQSQVAAWHGRHFHGDGPGDVALAVCEEAGELARAVLKRHQGIRGTHEQWTAAIADEIGDVVISLMRLAVLEHRSLPMLVRVRWAHVTRRDIDHDPAHPAPGVLEAMLLEALQLVTSLDVEPEPWSAYFDDPEHRDVATALAQRRNT